jgi:hypothetical protein
VAALSFDCSPYPTTPTSHLPNLTARARTHTQAVLLLALAARLHAHLPLCWLAQTLAFVALNKARDLRAFSRARTHTDGNKRLPWSTSAHTYLLLPGKSLDEVEPRL